MNKRKHLLLVGLVVVFLVLGVGIANAQDPTATANEPSVAVTATPMKVPGNPDLEIVGSHWARCRESSDSPQLGDLYWAVWEIRNNRKDAQAKGEARVTLVGANGVVLSSEAHTGRFLAPNAVGWNSNDGLPEGYALEGGGSRVEDIRLDLTDIQWVPVDDSADKYEYDIEFLGYETGDGDYPRHSFEVLVTNSSDFVMAYAWLFGVFFDKSGTMVDVAVSTRCVDLPFGQSKVLSAVSVSGTGRCLGERDPAGYSLHYWVHFYTYTDQIVTRYFTTELN